MSHAPSQFLPAYLEYWQQGKNWIATYDDVERAIKSHNAYHKNSPYWDTEEGQEELCIMKAYRESGLPRGSHTAAISEIAF